MRVLYFSDNQSVHNQRFLRKFALSQHEVWFCDLTNSSVRKDWLPSGIRQYTLASPAPKSVQPSEVEAFLPEIQRMITDIRPDLIHAGPVQTCGFLIALSGFHPLLVTSWGSDILLLADKDEKWREATRFTLSRADGFFVDSQWVLHSARRFAQIPDEQVVMFPWGLEQGRFGPQGGVPEGNVFRKEAGEFVILCTRNWEELYRIDMLLRSFLSAYRQNPNLRLLLIGNGSQETYLRDFIQSNDLSSVVTIPGFIEPGSLPQWFRAANGYISCAKSDGTSISLLEAMATGLPVIVTDIPSNREWVVPDVNGWLGSDEQSFAEAILRIPGLSHSEREAISVANCRAVAERANWDKNFPKLLSMYELLQERVSQDRRSTRIESQ